MPVLFTLVPLVPIIQMAELPVLCAISHFPTVGAAIQAGIDWSTYVWPAGGTFVFVDFVMLPGRKVAEGKSEGRFSRKNARPCEAVIYSFTEKKCPTFLNPVFLIHIFNYYLPPSVAIYIHISKWSLLFNNI